MRFCTGVLAAAVLIPIGSGLGLPSLNGQNKSSPPVQAKPRGSEKEARKLATTQLKELAIAFHTYLDEHKTFPPAALVAKNGKALLSWRVLVLPYINEDKLFREFRLTEPWDSPHNTKLLGKMPAVFAPTWGEKTEANTTLWQVFTGPSTIFEGSKGCRLSDITDGTSQTILFVEANRPVPWTRPQDFESETTAVILHRPQELPSGRVGTVAVIIGSPEPSAGYFAGFTLWE